MTGMSRERAARGFTLIELLVVVAIIALLISILLPSLAGAREQARAVQCLSNLRSMGAGIFDYAEDHLGVMPGPLHPPVYRYSAGGEGWSPMDPNTQRPWFLLARIAPMFSRDDELLKWADKVAACPTAVIKNPAQNFKPNFNNNPPHSRPYNYVVNSYGYKNTDNHPDGFWNSQRSWFFGWVNIGVNWQGWTLGWAQNSGNPTQGTYRPPRKFDSVKKPAEEWSLGDAWWQFKRVMLTPGNFIDGNLGTWQVVRAGGNSATGTCSEHPLPRAPYHRNARGTNLLYFDGHAAGFVNADQWAIKFPPSMPPPNP